MLLTKILDISKENSNSSKRKYSPLSISNAIIICFDVIVFTLVHIILCNELSVVINKTWAV